MKKRFSDEQIICILQEAEAGLSVEQLCRMYEISDGTFYNWRRTFTGQLTGRKVRPLDEVLPTGDPENITDRLKLRGRARLQKLLRRSGGILTARCAAGRLGCSEEALCERIQCNRLLAIRDPSGEWLLPYFQFDESAVSLLPYLEELLTRLSSWPQEEILRFLLVPHSPASTTERPLDILKQQNPQRVIELAELHLAQRP